MTLGCIILSYIQIDQKGAVMRVDAVCAEPQVVTIEGALLRTQLYAPLNTSDLRMFQLWQRIQADNARFLFNRPDFVQKYGYVFQGAPSLDYGLGRGRVEPLVTACSLSQRAFRAKAELW